MCHRFPDTSGSVGSQKSHAVANPSSAGILGKRHETNKLSKGGGYGKPKANAATPKTVTIAKETILPDRPDHDKPIYMGQFQWGPGT